MHIADVGHFIKAGTPIDTEAAARGTTVYLVNRRIDMVHERRTLTPTPTPNPNLQPPTLTPAPAPNPTLPRCPSDWARTSAPCTSTSTVRLRRLSNP